MANPNNVGNNNTTQQLLSQFGIPSSGQITPNSTDPAGGFSAGSAGDSMAGTFADPNGIIGGLYNDVMGFTSQQREFNQQLQMTQYENEWNSAAEQMKRAKAAGINPLTAAGGIAGNGSGSVAAAGGSASPTGISDIANAASSIAGLPSEIAQRGAAAEQSMSVARNADRLADAQILRDAASSASLLSSAGVPEIAAMELGLSLARNGLSGFAAAFNADNYCRRYDYEMDQIDANINAENARFENLQQQSNLYRSESQLASEKAMHENILKEYDQQKLNLAKQYRAMFADSDTLQQFVLAQDFGTDSKEYKAYMGFLKDKFYNQSKGQFDAEVDDAYDKAFNLAKGAQDVKNDSAEFESMIRQNEIWIKGFVQFLLNSNTSNPVDMIARFFNSLHAFQLGQDVQDSMMFGLDRALRNNAKPDKGGLPHYQDFQNR